MAQSQQSKKSRSITPKDLWQIFLTIVSAIAVVQELRKPKEDRTWHGTVADFIPYDFRMPSIERFRDTYWNPEGEVIGSKVWGAGWAPNFGAMWQRIAGSEALVPNGPPETESNSAE